MKDHVEEERFVDLDGDLESVIDHLRSVAEGLVNPYVEVVDRFGDYGHDSLVKGWRPMTEKELEQRKAKRKKDRERRAAQKAKKAEAEKKELERLAKKFGKTIS